MTILVAHQLSTRRQLLLIPIISPVTSYTPRRDPIVGHKYARNDAPISSGPGRRCKTVYWSPTGNPTVGAGRGLQAQHGTGGRGKWSKLWNSERLRVVILNSTSSSSARDTRLPSVLSTSAPIRSNVTCSVQSSQTKLKLQCNATRNAHLFCVSQLQIAKHRRREKVTC